jgi:LAO/AO transport system kinase
LTTAVKGEGIERLVEAVEAHQTHLIESGEWKERERDRVRSEMQTLLRDLLAERFLAHQSAAKFDEALDRVLTRSIDPRRAVVQLVFEAQAEAQSS